MLTEQLAFRIVCGLTRINSEKLWTGILFKAELSKTSVTLFKLKQTFLWINESNSTTIFELYAKMCRFYNRHKNDLIIIDHLQFLSNSDQKSERGQQITEILHRIEAVIWEPGISVIVLYQLNRTTEKKRWQPRLFDPWESRLINRTRYGYDFVIYGT